jgi:hypothetical protein
MMSTKRQLTDATISAVICPQMSRWPTSGGEHSWLRMKDAVMEMHGLARALEDQCSGVESDPDLNAGAVSRRTAELGKRAIGELAEFSALQKAQKAFENNLSQLEQKMKELPVQANDAPSVLRQQEIRAWISRQRSPIDAAVKGLNDPRIVSAILSAPHFLSNLSQAEHDLIASRCREALFPAQIAMKTQLTKAFGELNEGVSAAKRLLLERTGCREDSDGVVRGNHEPTPKPQLTKAAPREGQLAVVSNAEGA